MFMSLWDNIKHIKKMLLFNTQSEIEFIIDKVYPQHVFFWISVTIRPYQT